MSDLDRKADAEYREYMSEKKEDEQFNAGVDACIAAAKKEFDYWGTEGGTVTMGDLRFNLNLLFEQLKKPKQ